MSIEIGNQRGRKSKNKKASQPRGMSQIGSAQFAWFYDELEPERVLCYRVLRLTLDGTKLEYGPWILVPRVLVPDGTVAKYKKRKIILESPR